jgi:hypothetical protein
MAPYKICNFGKSVLMYVEEEDIFRTYDIDEMRFVRIPREYKDEETDEEEIDEETDEEYLESSCDEEW